MQFIKDFIRNLMLLVVIGIVLYMLFPDMMRQIFKLYGALLGPVAIVVLVVAALPRKHSRRPSKRSSSAK
jgi:peptidoglycan/LPS O-acetylase OafA/YrhL